VALFPLVRRMESAVAIATLNEFARCINAHKPKRIVSFCTDDHIFIDSLGCQMSGREFLEQAWVGYFSLFPDYRIEIEVAVSQGEVVLASGFASATHSTTKKSWRIPAAWRAIVRHGKIAEWQVYADNKPVYELLSRED